MQARWGARRGALALGIVWTLWHLPANLTSPSPLVQFTAQLIFTTSLSFVFSYLYNHSRGSIWLVIAFHGGLNGFNALLEKSIYPAIDESSWVVYYILLALVLGILSAVFLGDYPCDHLLRSRSRENKV